MSELLVVSDPETSGGIDSGRCGNLITRLQLLLDLSVLPEKQLNGALNQLGLGIRDYVSMSGLTEVEKRELLLLHSRVVDLAGVVIRELPARIE